MWSCDQNLVTLPFYNLSFKRIDQGQLFGTGTRYGLNVLRHCGKRVKIKSQKVLGVNSYVCRSYRGKTGRGAFYHPSPHSE